MLLSMYASYLWANRNKTTYVLRMVVFVLLSSFFSVFKLSWSGGGGFLLFMTFILTLTISHYLSFPFYIVIDEIYIPGRHWVYFHSIRFLTTDLTFAEWEGYDLVYMMQHNLWEQFLSTFYFFLFVNFLGVLLGYLIAKKYRIQFLNDKQGITLCISIAIAFIIVGMFGSGTNARVGVSFFGFGIFLLNIILFKKLVLPLTRGFVQTLREITKR